MPNDPRASFFCNSTRIVVGPVIDNDDLGVGIRFPGTGNRGTDGARLILGGDDYRK